MCYNSVRTIVPSTEGLRGWDKKERQRGDRERARGRTVESELKKTNEKGEIKESRKQTKKTNEPNRKRGVHAYQCEQ